MDKKEIEKLRTLINQQVNRMVDLLSIIDEVDIKNKNLEKALKKIEKLGSGEASIIAREALK